MALGLAVFHGFASVQNSLAAKPMGDPCFRPAIAAAPFNFSGLCANLELPANYRGLGFLSRV
jgi:hypothetical protein